MEQILIKDLSSKIPYLIERVKKGEEVIVTQEGKVVFKIVPLITTKAVKGFGSGYEDVIYIADDFDETPEDFKEYIS